MRSKESRAIAEIESTQDQILLKVGGTWRLTETLPELDAVMPREFKSVPVKVVPTHLEAWDSSLPLFLLRVREWCRARQAALDMASLPAALQQLFDLISRTETEGADAQVKPEKPRSLLAIPRRITARWKNSVTFVGECVLTAIQVPARPRYFCWKDFFLEMVDAGPRALPIVGLLSFLVGLTFAFAMSAQLEKFGAAGFMVQAVGVAVLRQIAPLIAAIVQAGRTGASFAARIADMKLGGELDALEMVAASPVQYLILPRIAAMSLMMPLVTLYADFFGILGGLVIAAAKLNMPASGFWAGLLSSVGHADLNVGIVKSVVFGFLIGLASTMRGLQSERSSTGVGRAVTSAVVTGIAAVIAADALFAPILKDLDV